MDTCQFIKQYIEDEAMSCGFRKYTLSTAFTVKVKDKVFAIHRVDNDKHLSSSSSRGDNGDIIEIYIGDGLSTDSNEIKELCKRISGEISRIGGAIITIKRSNV